MTRKVLAVAAVVTGWFMLMAAIDNQRAKRRRELWAEATGGSGVGEQTPV